ncbi:hypothetical protein GGS26DRAFT_591223 [Hypomontagnella submonticulosa]|nr:hypothetical protein GGS26DRAFT_591223 [Hypomontagnella submonticulosa]
MGSFVGLYLAVLLLLSSKVSGDDECQPYQWKRKAYPVGEIACRYDTTTGQDVNYYTCTRITEKYEISFEKLRDLNPALDEDCKNIKPNTAYCVAGFHEPLRAWDGLCGPKHNNATCIGTDKQCCNSETWQCGDSEEDCQAGTCYEGACESAIVDNFTLDGKCGPENGGQKCGGKWGDCCNFSGVCGTGNDFCDDGKCESGNCTLLLDIQSSVESDDSKVSTKSSPWQTGTTRDGTCGGPNHYTCDVLYGSCCSPEGVCGSEEEQCGNGCQSKYGKCNNGTSIVYLGDYEQFKRGF